MVCNKHLLKKQHKQLPKYQRPSITHMGTGTVLRVTVKQPHTLQLSFANKTMYSDICMSKYAIHTTALKNQNKRINLDIKCDKNQRVTLNWSFVRSGPIKGSRCFLEHKRYHHFLVRVGSCGMELSGVCLHNQTKISWGPLKDWLKCQILSPHR